MRGEGLDMETNWFVVQSRPRQEKFAAAHAAQLDVEVFLPLVREEQKVAGVLRRVVRALFPCYFFVRFCPSISFQALSRIRGCVRVVGTGAGPTPVPSDVVADLRSYAGPEGVIDLESHMLRPGDLVVVRQGPFEGLLGRVERATDGRGRVAILLEALRGARMEVDGADLEPAEAM